MAIWPSLARRPAEAKKISNSFRLTPQLRVDLEIADLEFTGSSAIVTCSRRDELTLSRGKPIVNESTVTFLLRRYDGDWIIESITG